MTPTPFRPFCPLAPNDAPADLNKEAVELAAKIQRNLEGSGI